MNVNILADFSPTNERASPSRASKGQLGQGPQRLSVYASASTAKANPDRITMVIQDDVH